MTEREELERINAAYGAGPLPSAPLAQANLAPHDLTSLPASVRVSLEQNPGFHNAVHTLASTQPDLAALAYGATLGHQQLAMQLVEVNTGFERMEKRFLGIRCGEYLVPTVTTRTINRTYRLS